MRIRNICRVTVLVSSLCSGTLFAQCGVESCEGCIADYSETNYAELEGVVQVFGSNVSMFSRSAQIDALPIRTWSIGPYPAECVVDNTYFFESELFTEAVVPPMPLPFVASWPVPGNFAGGSAGIAGGGGASFADISAGVNNALQKYTMWCCPLDVDGYFGQEHFVCARHSVVVTSDSPISLDWRVSTKLGSMVELVQGCGVSKPCAAEDLDRPLHVGFVLKAIAPGGATVFCRAGSFLLADGEVVLEGDAVTFFGTQLSKQTTLGCEECENDLAVDSHHEYIAGCGPACPGPIPPVLCGAVCDTPPGPLPTPFTSLTIVTQVWTNPCPPDACGLVCAADLNGDGSLDGDDVILFFVYFNLNSIFADIDRDGDVDGDDVIEFFRLWDGGCTE